MFSSGGLSAEPDQILELQYFFRTGVGAGRNQQQKVTTRGDAHMIPVIWHQGVTKRIEPGSDRLTAIILTGLGKVEDSKQSVLCQAIIDGIARTALGLRRDLVAKPDFQHTVRIRLNAGTLDSEDLADCIRDSGISQRADRLRLGVLPCTLQAEQAMHQSNRGQSQKDAEVRKTVNSIGLRHERF